MLVTLLGLGAMRRRRRLEGELGKSARHRIQTEAPLINAVGLPDHETRKGF
jgi:hypothetical protein